MVDAEHRRHLGEKIRVLMVNSEGSWRGGEAQVDLLVKGLVEKGVAVALAAPPDSALAEKVAKLGVPVLPLPIAGGADFRAVGKLLGYLRGNVFDIVHCHSSHAHGIAWLALGIHRGLRGPGRSRPRLVVSRRVDFPIAANGPSGGKYRWGVDRFLAISTGVEKALVDGGVKKENIEIVPDGIDLAKFDGIGDTSELAREFGLAETAVVVGNVAALAPHKSQKDFVSAARIIRDEIAGARFLVVGEGELRSALEAQVRELGLDNVLTLTGFRRDVLGILSLFDCFVLSSYLEGLCTSIMDAHALGVPVVATRTGGVPDLVADGDTGLLVPPRDPVRLAGAVVRMLRDDDLRSRCVRRGKEQARRYGYAGMVEGTLETYRRLLVAA